MLTVGNELLRATARGAFWQQFAGGPNIFDGLIFEVESNAPEEIYPWFAYAPPVAEFTGSTEKTPVPELNWTIVNKQWQTGQMFPYSTRRFDKLGAVQSAMSEMARKMREHVNVLVSSLVSAGHSTACYDSQFFFDTDHSDPGASYTTSQNNDLTVAATTETAPTDIEFGAAVRAGIDAFYTFKDGAGDPYVPPPDAKFSVMVAPGYRSINERVAKVDQLTGPVGNDLQGSYTPIVNPWLPAVATDSSIYLFWTSGPRKPFILQNVDPVSVEDDLDKTTRDFSFDVWSFRNVGYGEWRHGCKVTFT